MKQALTRKTSLFRFRLRTLLLATGVLAVAFGLLGNVLIHARRQAAIATKIKAVRGGFEYYSPYEGMTFPEPTYAIWCRKAFGENVCRNIKWVYLSSGQNPAEALEAIKQLPKLEAVRLGPAECSDANLHRLTECSTIRWIELEVVDSPVTVGAITQLRGLPHLRHLTLRGAGVDDELLAGVAALTQLEELSLASTSVTPNGFRTLATAPQLKSLALYDCSVDGSALLHVDHQHLTGLRLFDLPNFTPRDVAMIGRFTNLQKLTICNCAIGDEGLKQLPEMPELFWIYLPETGITDASVPELLRQPKLTELHLQGTEITLQGLVELCKTPKVKTITTSLVVSGKYNLQVYNGVKGRVVRDQQR